MEKNINENCITHNIRVTGASGFIGKRLISSSIIFSDALLLTRAKSDNKKNLYISNLGHTEADFTGFTENSNVLINLAGELQKHNQMHSLHVEGTERLLDSIKKTNISNQLFHWIQLSSCGAYGVESYKSSEVEITESTPTSPQSTYEVTKTLADELIVEFAKNHDWFKYTIIRPTIVFGEGMRSNAIQRLVKLIKLRLFFYVEDKESIANYVHVDDVVSAINLCIMNEKAFNQVFIVSNDCQFKDFVNSIARSIHVGNPLFVLKKKTAIGLVQLINFFGLKSIKEEQLNVLSRKVHFSSAKIQQAIGWKPKADVLDQLEKMINKTI